MLCFRMRSATTTTQDGGTQNCISTCATLRAHIRALDNYSYDVMNRNITLTATIASVNLVCPISL